APEGNLGLADLTAEVNARVRELANGRLAEWGGCEWEFLCECGDADCTELVTLSLYEFESRKRWGEAVLAPGHRQARARAARRRASELRADAQALRGQARHQAGRARRNLEN